MNFAGYLRTESGVGTAGRRYLRALRYLGCPLSLFDLSPLSGNRAEDSSVPAAPSPDGPHETNIICADIQLHFAAVDRLGEAFFRDRYTIGIWAWELPTFPERWYDRFAYYDEIWVGTSFIANALAPVSPIPVVRIPPVLVPSAGGSRARGRKRLALRREEFVFLFVFDFHSRVERKNPGAVVEAFRLAFAPSDGARLVIKCINPGSNRTEFDALTRAARGYPVDMYGDYWTAHEMQDLMAACDAYVSLHRSEGTGLTITDAMAQGKPVIATGWSGNADFMTLSNSYPVRWQLTQIMEQTGQYAAGDAWAEPSVDHAAELMRHVFEHREEADTRGAAAQAEIEEGYSEEAVAGLIARRLSLRATRERFGDLKRDLRAGVAEPEGLIASFSDLEPFVPARYLRYQELIRQVRAAVDATVPPAASVLVTSKGDDELLRLPGRRAEHFPQTGDGHYAGHHPADSREAIEHLEALRARGSQFLLFPSTGAWWLDHYQGLRQHLDRRYVRIWGDQSCTIYHLTPSSEGDA